MAGTGFVCERWQQPFDDPSRNWWNSTQSSQEDAMNTFVAAIERVVVIFLKGKSSEVLHTQGWFRSRRSQCPPVPITSPNTGYIPIRTRILHQWSADGC